MTPYTKKSLIALGVLTLVFAFSQWRLNKPTSLSPEEMEAFENAMAIEQMDVNDPKRKKAIANNQFTKGLLDSSINPDKPQKKVSKQSVKIKERQEKLFNDFGHSFKQSELKGEFKIVTERGILSDFEFTFELPEPTNLTDEEIIQGLNLVAVDMIEGKIFFKSSGQSISLKKDLQKDLSLTKKGSAKALVRIGENRSILPCKIEFIFKRSTETPEILTIKAIITRNELALPEGKKFYKKGSNLSELAFRFEDTQKVVISDESEAK